MATETLLEKLAKLHTPAQRVAAYIRLRDARDASKKAFVEAQKPLLGALENLEGRLLQDLITLGANSLACPAGTVYQSIDLSATVANREEFLAHVKAHELWEALDVKANKTFIRDHLNETGEPIPGVKITQTASVGVRRS